MSVGSSPAPEVVESGPRRRALRWVDVQRRGPILRPAMGSRSGDGLYGLDLTAGCAHGCPFCHIRGSSLFPGEGRILFDPSVCERLAAALDGMDGPPRRVVLSPASDPLPPHRGVRAQALRAVEMLLGRGIEVVLLTRGRVSRAMIERLADHPRSTRVAVGVVALARDLSRT